MILRSRQVEKEPWEDRKREYKKITGGDRIKQGMFGIVSRHVHTDSNGAKKIVVIKQVEHQPGHDWQEEHEVECFRRLNNHHRFRGHVIKLLNVFHEVEGKKVANIFVMESGICSLLQIQRCHSWYSTPMVQTWMRSLARAVWACHEKQVMHRDIKPANCIMCLGPQESILELKLADFGNSVVVSAGPPVSGVSFALEWATTPNYCAPELFRGFHTFEGDVWSIGVICSELLHTEPGE